MQYSYSVIWGFARVAWRWLFNPTGCRHEAYGAGVAAVLGFGMVPPCPACRARSESRQGLGEQEVLPPD